MENSLPEKHIYESESERLEVVMPYHLNGAGRLFGGQLTAWIDKTAGIVGRRHCNCYVTTASIEKLTFRQPVYANELVVLHGKVIYVGRTSLVIRVDCFVEDLSGTRRLVNTAYLTEVALDANGKPTPVPGLICETFQEKAEFEAAEKRHESLKKARLEL